VFDPDPLFVPALLLFAGGFTSSFLSSLSVVGGTTTSSFLSSLSVVGGTTISSFLSSDDANDDSTLAECVIAPIGVLYEKLNETLSFKDDISNSTVTVSLSLSKLNFVSTSLSFTIPFIAVNIFPFVNVITMYFFPSTVFNLLLFKNF